MIIERVYGYCKFDSLRVNGFYLVSRRGYYYSQYPWVINTDGKTEYTEEEFNKQEGCIFFRTKKEGEKALFTLAKQLEDMHPELKEM